MQFLYAAYEPSCWWFEVFETARRLILTGGQSMLRPGTPSQILLNLIICISSMRVYAKYKPFVKDKNDRLAEVAQWQLFFTMPGALCIKVNINDEDGYDRMVFDLGLTVIQGMAPALLAYDIILYPSEDDVIPHSQSDFV